MIGRSLMLAAALALTATAATAQSYNFNSFATNGQNFQNATLGPMTLSSENGVLTYISAYGGGLYDGFAASSDITMTFSQAISGISVRAGDGAGDFDAFGLLVYAFGTNAFLGSFYTPQFGGDNEPEWYTLTVSGIGNIGRVVFDPCNSGACPGTIAGEGGVVVTDIDLTPSTVVPEPSTVALTLAGLVGTIALACRRRAA